MADITISYKGSNIATINASGTKILKTAGTYCEDDIEIIYNSPGGAGSGEAVIFEDRNTYVLDYLAASETYTEANRNTTSVIGNYANTSIQD
jgi:hypothetical protein